MDQTWQAFPSAIYMCETHRVCRRDGMTELTVPLLVGGTVGGRLDC